MCHSLNSTHNKCVYIYIYVNSLCGCVFKQIIVHYIMCNTKQLCVCVCVSVHVLRVHISFTDQFIKFE